MALYLERVMSAAQHACMYAYMQAGLFSNIGGGGRAADFVLWTRKTQKGQGHKGCVTKV